MMVLKIAQVRRVEVGWRIMTEANTNKRAGGKQKSRLASAGLVNCSTHSTHHPFHERGLDPDAEEYIVGSAEEVGRHAPLCLVVHLPADQLPNSAVTDLGPSIHNYFAYRAESERRRLRLLFHDGRIALATGLAFLFVVYSCENSRSLF